MLKHIHHLLQLQVGLFLVVQLALLYMQGAALRRHGHRCFLLLIVSTVCGVCVLAASGAVLVFTPSEALLVWSYSLGFLFGIAQGFFALAGAKLLFRDYRRLSEHFDSTSAIQNPK